MDHDANELAETDDTATDDTVAPVEHTDSTVDELLIEEISIDGMCGVY